MSNPLFSLFGGQNTMMNPLMQRFQQFQQMFRGDPNQQIRQIMNSGKVNQQQYNQAVQMAQQLKQMLGGR
jgi:hypothetical protein